MSGLLRAKLKCRSCEKADIHVEERPIREPAFQRTRGKRPTWQLKGICDLCQHRVQGFVKTAFAEENNAVDDRLENPPCEDDVCGKVDFSAKADEAE